MLDPHDVLRQAALLLACICTSVAAHAAAPSRSAKVSSEAEEVMQWFADAKFGIFLHFGIYAVDGIDESWSFFEGYVSYGHYMQQLKRFTAANYRSQAWAELIRESGARSPCSAPSTTMA